MMTDRHRPRRGCHRTRRGSTYIIVLGTAMIASLLGLSALMIQRIQRSADQFGSDIREARLYADAALRIGMLRIENDPDWRYSFSNGVWEADIPIGDGTYTLEGIDPSDGDLTDGAEDLLNLIGTGKKGSAIQKVQLTLTPTYRGYSCLESALHSGVDVKITNATVECDQTISANQDMDASNSTVNCDVAAVNNIAGSTYNGGTEQGIEPLELPGTDDVFDYYLANGTSIDVNSLPLGFTNLLKNPGLEAGAAAWAPWEPSPGNPTSTISSNTTEHHSGAGSLEVADRGSFQAGPVQDISNIVQSNVTYECYAWVKMKTTGADVHFVIDVNSTGGGGQLWASGDTGVDVGDGWVLVADTLTPTFTGTVISATLKIETELGDPVDDFFIDDVVFKETGNERTIYQKVLSPTSNPFGAETNRQGIYLIDLDGQDIFIKNSRIVGTLVLLSPGSNSRIGHRGALSWEPAIPNLPALLVKDADITINPSTIGLVENANNANFNPTGTPYLGLGDDSDQNDTYPSVIKGMIYGTNKITFRRAPVIFGAVVAEENIEIRNEFDLTHNPIYLSSPPPGFNGPEEIRILLDSVQKVPE